MNEADLKTFLDDNKEAILAKVKERAIENLLSQHSWNITSQIATAVNEFVAAEIIPAVKLELASNRGALVGGAISGLTSVSDELAKGMVKAAFENLSSSYKREQVIKAPWC